MPRTTQQMMIMIFFCTGQAGRGGLRLRGGSGPGHPRRGVPEGGLRTGAPGDKDQNWNWGRCRLECTQGGSGCGELKALGSGLRSEPRDGIKAEWGGLRGGPRGSEGQTGLLTRRALLWYLTAFLVSDTALST